MPTKPSKSFANSGWQFSFAGCLVFLTIELAYLIFLWDLHARSVDPGIATLLAGECWFMFQISTTNVKQKHREGATSKGGMLYTRIAGIALLVLMAATLPSLHLPDARYVGILACFVTCFGRIMWLKQDTARLYLSSS